MTNGFTDLEQAYDIIPRQMAMRHDGDTDMDVGSRGGGQDGGEDI